MACGKILKTMLLIGLRYSFRGDNQTSVQIVMLKFIAIFCIPAKIRNNPEGKRWLVKYVMAYLYNEIP